MLTFFAFALILSVGTSLLMALNMNKKKKVNWPHVYELEHEIWPEIRHDRNHYFNTETDCRKCFNESRRVEGRATPFLATKQKPDARNWRDDERLLTETGYRLIETRPPPPKYISVRASNEPLVATHSANAPLVQTMAFETIAVRCRGEVPSLRMLITDHSLGWSWVGDCYWVTSEREYFVCLPHKGWSKI